METVLNNLVKHKHDINSFICELYNSIEVLEYIAYYKSTLDISFSASYMSCNTLCIVMSSCKRYSKSIHSTIYNIQFDDARRFECITDYKSQLDICIQYGHINKLKKILMTQERIFQYNNIIQLLKYAQNKEMLCAMISWLDKSVIKDKFSDILRTVMTSKMLSSLLNEVLIVNDDTVTFNGIKLDMTLKKLHSMITCIFECNVNVVAEYIKAISMYGYDFYTNDITVEMYDNAAIADRIVSYNLIHSNTFDATEALFELGYTNIYVRISTRTLDRALYISKIHNLLTLCCKYQVNINASYTYERNQIIPLICYSTDKAEFDALIKCNQEYVIDIERVKILIQALTRHNKPLLKHYVNSHVKHLLNDYMSLLIPCADDDEILKLIQIKNATTLLSYINVDAIFDLDYDVRKNIVKALVKKYTRNKPLSPSIVVRYIKQYILGKPAFSDMLSLYISCVNEDINTYIDSKLVKDCIDKASLHILECILKHGYDVNREIHNGMDVVEYVVLNCVHCNPKVVYNLVKQMCERGFNVSHACDAATAVGNHKLAKYLSMMPDQD